jgi:hypothetical protein
VKRAHFAPVCVWLALGCGRTELGIPDTSGVASGGQGGAPELADECAMDSDCSPTDVCVQAVCAPAGSRGRLTCQMLPLDCDDHQTCSLDRCDVSAGGCVHEWPVDGDHDGYIGKAPAGVPASCGGPDCNDSDPQIHPGAPEQCDGIDNDCNGFIDDGSVYTPQGVPVPIASDRAEVGGLVFDGSSYALTFTDYSASFHGKSYFELMNASGQATAGPSLVSDINADTFAGSLAFSGSTFLTAWKDARQAADYEVYFTRFDDRAQKLMPDQRLTNSIGYSLDPVVRFTGSEYVVMWEDERLSRGTSGIFAHRVSEQGEPIGDEVELTDPDEAADSVDFDVSDGRLGVAYVAQGPVSPDGQPTTEVRFRSFDLTLADGSGPFDLGTNGQMPSVTKIVGGFAVAWPTGDQTNGPGNALQAAIVDPSGKLFAARAITSGDTHAKWHTVVSLGDRLVVIWSATPTDADPYQLFHEIVSAQDLAVLRPRQLLWKSPLGDDLYEPGAVLGPNGDVGVTYEENITNFAYFMRLGCAIVGPLP